MLYYYKTATEVNEMIKYCIFDLDGTLLNTLSTITYYVNKTIEAEGLAPIAEDECRYFVGNGAELLIRRALAARDFHDEQRTLEIFEQYKKNYDTSPLYLTKPYDGIPELLSTLTERGIRCAVLSNKQHEAVVPVVKAFFGDLITSCRGGMAGVPLKPSPEAAYQMLGELGASACEVAYIGDTGVDMQTGKAFGAAKTIGVTWGFRPSSELAENGADVLVSSAQELLEQII